MITTAADVIRERGDNYAIRWQTKENGVGLDITGATFKLTVDTRKDPPDSATQVFQVTGAIIDALNGIYEFVPSPGQMNLTPKTYFFDVEMTKGGQVATLVKGKFIVKQDITK